MARIFNPYQAQTPIGAAIANLGDALLGGPTPQETALQQAQIDGARALADERRTAAMAERRKAEARGGISDLFSELPAAVAEFSEFVGPRPADQPQTAADFSSQALQDAHRQAAGLGVRGGLDPNNISGLLGLMLNAHGASDDALIRNSASTHIGPIGVNQAVSRAGQEEVREANAANSIAETIARVAATPLTESQFNARTLAGLSNEDQRTAALGAQAFGSPVERVADPNSPSGVRLVPRGEAAGQPGVAPGATSRSDIIPSSVRSEALSTLSNAQTTRETIAQLRELAADPTNFGAVGFLREAVQDAAQQGSAFAQILGLNGQTVQRQIQDTARDLVAVGDQPVPLGSFDPNLPQLEFATNLLAYQLAFINSPDGRVSNQDFQIARQTIGGGGPLANREDFLSRLEVMELLIDSRERAARGALRSDSPGSPAITSPAATASGPRPGPGDVVVEFDASGRRIK